MTQIKVDTIVDAAGTGAADFADGITIAGNALSALNTAEYYSSASEPTSPKNGAIWWDTANEKVMVYIADEFKEVVLGAAAGPVIWTVDISQISYDSVSFSVTSQDSSPRGLDFNTDGTKMYMTGTGTQRVFQYSLSTGFDLSTASYDSVSVDLSGTISSAMDIRLSSDGTKMYVNGNFNTIYQWNLSTAFDLSTASYSNTNFSATSQTNNSRGFRFNADGTKMYLVDGSPEKVFQYSLSTAWDLSTASYDSVFYTSSETDDLIDVSFNTDGTRMYLLSRFDQTFYQYSLSTGFDISTASYDSVSSPSINSQTGTLPHSTKFSADGTKLFVLSNGNDAIYQYSTGL